VLLSLHGAMAADSEDDPEGDLLTRVRALVGPGVPVISTHDPHANVTRKMVAQATALFPYHTIPHTDHFQAAERAAALLLRLLREPLPTAAALVKLPMIAPADHHNTAEEPMRPLFELARRYEQQPGVLSAGLFPVQPWLDIAELGWSALVISAGDAELARRLAQELARRAWDARERFVTLEQYTVEEALEAAERVPGQPVVVSDQADNTGGGAPGDSTALLSVALRRPTPRPIYLTVTDPETVRQAVAAGPGATITAEVGGKIDRRYHRPVPLTARVATLTDGVFTMTGATWHGQKVNMGRTAVLEVDGIFIVTTERHAWTLDPELYRSVGLVPERA
jgi:microcystin degradation protein MlrC